MTSYDPNSLWNAKKEEAMKPSVVPSIVEVVKYLGYDNLKNIPTHDVGKKLTEHRITADVSDSSGRRWLFEVRLSPIVSDSITGSRVLPARIKKSRK